MSRRRLIVTIFLLPMALPSPSPSLAADPPVWTLEHCLKLAREGNIELRTAAAEVELAGAVEDFTRADRKPVLSTAGDFGWVSDVMHIDMPAATFPGAGITIPGRRITVGGRDTYDLGLTVSYPIDVGGRLGHRLKAAGSDYRAGRLSMEAARNRVTFKVARVYLELIKAGLQLETAESARREVAAHLEDVRNYNQQGMMPEVELLRTGVELARIDVLITRAKHLIRLRRVELLTLLDMDLSTEFDISPGLPDGPARVVGEPGNVRPDPGRPELDALSYRINAARSRVSAARAAGRPQLSLFGGTNYGKPGLDRFRNEWMAYLRLGMSADFNLWDGGRVDAGVAREEMTLRVQELGLEELTGAVEADRIRAELALESASEQHELNRKILAQAEESYRMVESRFQQGLESNTDYLQARTSLTRAQLEARSAEIDLLIARADLRRALGAFRE